MNDIIYVKNIPLNYNYAVFGNGYVDLYNSNYVGSNSNYDYYRVWFYSNTFQSIHYSSYSYSSFNVNATQIRTTNNFLYRQDISSIFLVSFFVIVAIYKLMMVIFKNFIKGGF